MSDSPTRRQALVWIGTALAAGAVGYGAFTVLGPAPEAEREEGEREQDDLEDEREDAEDAERDEQDDAEDDDDRDED